MSRCQTKRCPQKPTSNTLNAPKRVVVKSPSPKHLSGVVRITISRIPPHDYDLEVIEDDWLEPDRDYC